MKKILALILALLLAVMVVGCSDNGGKVDTDLPQQCVTDNNTDISENPSDELKPQNENKKIEAVTYDQFKEIIGYSMFPYDTTPDPEKNMLKICSGFNGDVELTYISFVLSKNAEKYFAEIVEKLDGEVVMTENSDEYNICKIKMGDVYYGDSYGGNSNYDDLAKDNYFVSILFPDGGKFPIVYNNQYLSFIKDINWYLNGNCSINVKNYVYDCKGSSCSPKFRYRPISLQEPFPDDNIPKNWSSWWDDFSNQTRIKDTYNNGIFYSIDLIHGSNTNGKNIAIGDTNIFDDMDYNDWDNIQSN